MKYLKPDVILLTKKSSFKNWKTIQEADSLITVEGYKSVLLLKEDMKYIAESINANGIINLSISKKYLFGIKIKFFERHILTGRPVILGKEDIYGNEIDDNINENIEYIYNFYKEKEIIKNSERIFYSLILIFFGALFLFINDFFTMTFFFISSLFLFFFDKIKNPILKDLEKTN